MSLILSYWSLLCCLWVYGLLRFVLAISDPPHSPLPLTALFLSSCLLRPWPYSVILTPLVSVPVACVCPRFSFVSFHVSSVLGPGLFGPTVYLQLLRQWHFHLLFFRSWLIYCFPAWHAFEAHNFLECSFYTLCRYMRWYAGPWVDDCHIRKTMPHMGWAFLAVWPWWS